MSGAFWAMRESVRIVVVGAHQVIQRDDAIFSRIYLDFAGRL